MHFHGHWNKMVPLMEPSILVDLTMALRSTITLFGRLMTLEATISHVRSITTTSATKIWSFQIM